MQLTVRDISKLLSVSENTIYGWIQKGGLPANEIGGHYRINRSELLEWATSHNVSVPPGLFDSGKKDAEALPGLSAALDAGGVFHGVSAPDKAAVLEAIVGLMPLPEGVDRELLLRMLLAREALESTGIGDGIALPHPRNPIVLRVSEPLVTLCFLEKPVEFGALDGKPVYALFSLVTPTPRVHLHMLARLSFALQRAGFRDAVVRRAPRADILCELRRMESEMAGAQPAPVESQGRAP